MNRSGTGGDTFRLGSIPTSFRATTRRLNHQVIKETHMYQPTRTKKSLSKNNSKGVSRWRRGLLLGALALSCFALSPTAQAVTPAPDGGYPGGNTAEGDDALFSLTTGANNTAIGFNALYFNTT